MKDSRRCVIARVRREHLTDLLTGRLEAVNFPKDGEIQAMVIDMASDSVIMRIESEQFPVVPQFENFPHFELRMNVLVSAASES